MNHITRFVGLVAITAGTAFLGSLIEFEPPATQYGPELPTRGQIRARRLAEIDSRLRELNRIQAELEANQRNRFMSQYRANCLHGRDPQYWISISTSPGLGGGESLGSYCLRRARVAYIRSR